MFFNRKRHDLEQAKNEYSFTPTNAEIAHEDLDNTFYEGEKKRAFYSILHGKPFAQILGELVHDFSRRIAQQTSLSNQKVQSIEHQITALRIEINERKVLLKNTAEIEDRYTNEIQEIELTIDRFYGEFRELVEALGTAHTNMIPERIRAAKQELEDLRAAYQEIFQNKYKDESDYLKALEKRRDLVDKLIGDGHAKLTIVQEKITDLLKFGNTRLSASFLFAVGTLSAIAAGWFFSVFSSSNDFDRPTWLFFGLSNMFNYLFLHVEQYGPMRAFTGMLIHFTLLLIFTTALFWFIQMIIVRLTNDETNIEFGFNFNEKSTGFFRLKIKAKSLLSFWLQGLPWIFVLGVIIIVLTIGQYLGSETHQITELGERLSGQLVGTIITLISTAIFFLFVSYVIEKTADTADATNHQSELKKDRYRKNKELTLLVASINIVVLAVIINSLIGSNLPRTQLIFSVLCFILLLNITAFTLSYGIRQRGLLKTNEELEAKLSYLSNLRASISGSTPVHLWIREGNQFQEGFLAFQKDILELSKQKNRLLNPNKRFKKFLEVWFKKDAPHLMSAERFGEMTKSPNREKQFFLRNFPEISYKIATVRNKLNEAKRELDLTKTRLKELRDGHSDFQTNLNDEIRGRKGQITVLQNNIFEIRQNNFQFSASLEKQRKRLELEIMQGAELGTWTRETLIKTITNEQNEQS